MQSNGVKADGTPRKKPGPKPGRRNGRREKVNAGPKVNPDFLAQMVSQFDAEIDRLTRERDRLTKARDELKALA